MKDYKKLKRFLIFDPKQPQDLSLPPHYPPPSVFNFSPSIAAAFLRSAALKQEATAVKDEIADGAERTIVSNVDFFYSSVIN